MYGKRLTQNLVLCISFKMSDMVLAWRNINCTFRLGRYKCGRRRVYHD